MNAQCVLFGDTPSGESERISETRGVLSDYLVMVIVTSGRGARKG